MPGTARLKFLAPSRARLFFTSGGTESNNLAIFGAARPAQAPGPAPHHFGDRTPPRCCIASNISRRTKAFDVTYLPVSREGVVSPVDLKKTIRPDTVLVSIMAANNEIGTIQPLRNSAPSAVNARVLVSHRRRAYGSARSLLPTCNSSTLIWFRSVLTNSTDRKAPLPYMSVRHCCLIR